MAKMRKCDDCVCQGICRIEDDYRTISKNMDQVYNSDGKDGYFYMPELICHRFIRKQPVSRTNNFGNEASNKILNQEAMTNLRTNGSFVETYNPLWHGSDKETTK